MLNNYKYIMPCGHKCIMRSRIGFISSLLIKDGFLQENTP